MDLRSGHIIGGQDEEESTPRTSRSEESRSEETTRGEGKTEIQCLMEMFQKVEKQIKENEDKRERERKKKEAKREKESLELKNMIQENIGKISEVMDKKLENMKIEFKEAHKQFQAEIDRKIKLMEKKNEEVVDNMNKTESSCKSRTVQIWESIKVIEDKTMGKDQEIEREIQKLGNRIEENKKKLEEVENKIGEERTHPTRTDGEQEELIRLRRELQDEINKMREQQGQTRIIYAQNMTTAHKFDGKASNIHPVVFMKTIKNKIKGLINIDEIKEIIREHLERESLTWFEGKEHEVNDIQSFEKLFLKYFWGEEAQNRVREKLYFGKFCHESKTSMAKYALHLYAMSKHLTPIMPEHEIIQYISRQYKYQIAENLAIQNVNSMDQLCNYLNRVERNTTTNDNHTYRNNTRQNNQTQNRNYNQYTSNPRYNQNFNNYRNNNTTQQNQQNMNNTQYNRQFNNNMRYYNNNDTRYNNNNRVNNNANMNNQQRFNYNNNGNTQNNNNYRYNNNNNFNNNNNPRLQDTQRGQNTNTRQVNFHINSRGNNLSEDIHQETIQQDRNRRSRSLDILQTNPDTSNHDTNPQDFH